MRKFFWSLLVWLVIAVPSWGMPNLNNKSVTTKILNNAGVCSADVRLYQKIFQDIKNDNIQSALKSAKKVKNNLLMGHVQAGIFLSKSYKSTPDELKAWLQEYSYLPQARSVYYLAVQKAGRDNVINPWGEKYPRLYSPYSWFNNQYEDKKPEDRVFLRRQVELFRKYLNKRKTKAAQAILENYKLRMTIPDREYDAMSVTLATVYLLDNQNKLALSWVKKAINRSHDVMGYWVGGLAAWRMRQYKTAATLFSALSLKEDDEWLVSAGAYWAYRSYGRLGNKKEAHKHLQRGAVYKRTFYGMLAAYKLGIPFNYNWQGMAVVNDYTTDEYLQELLKSEAVTRALILMQTQNFDLAEKEIRGVYKKLNDKQKEALLFMAQSYGMHSVAILLANDIKNNHKEIYYDKAAYPNPEFMPKGGWKISKSLAWAFVRQESAFKADAKSFAGAKGLMQLMPATAFHISKNHKIKENSDILFQYDYNLFLGQSYLSYLAAKSYINNNLFYLAAAYNAGPGNLYKWQKNVKYDDDPLLFIEVIPAKETRIYIERVMANLWVYEAFFNEKSPSLDALAEDRWPVLQKL